MQEEYGIMVENRMVKEKRDINVYHRYGRSAHIISHGSKLQLSLKSTGEDDYLHISVVSGPGNLWKHCWIALPSWADFEIFAEGKVTITHRGERTLIDIPPGPPRWELKLTRPNNGQDPVGPALVTIGDEEPV